MLFGSSETRGRTKIKLIAWKERCRDVVSQLAKPKGSKNMAVVSIKAAQALEIRFTSQPAALEIQLNTLARWRMTRQAERCPCGAKFIVSISMEGFPVGVLHLPRPCARENGLCSTNWAFTCWCLLG